MQIYEKNHKHANTFLTKTDTILAKFKPQKRLFSATGMCILPIRTWFPDFL